MYSVIFSDDKKFIFTKQQIMLIPYFNTLITSSSFLEKDNINILSSGIGFEYIHMYATMDEIDIIDPNDKYLFVIKQCDYFGYDKLKTLLEEKYGYKTDITDAKEKVGKELTVKIKYLGKFYVKKQEYPYTIKSYEYINGYPGTKITSSDSKLNTHYNKLNFHKYGYGENNRIGNSWSTYGGFTYDSDDLNLADHPSTMYKFCEKYILYTIHPFYEYPDYSTDEEISEIFKKRYREKYNVYFVKMIQNIISSFGKDDIICVKIKDSYKLLSEATEDEYKNIECIIVDNEPKFGDKYFIKRVDDNLEIFELT